MFRRAIFNNISVDLRSRMGKGNSFTYMLYKTCVKQKTNSSEIIVTKHNLNITRSKWNSVILEKKTMFESNNNNYLLNNKLRMLQNVNNIQTNFLKFDINGNTLRGSERFYCDTNAIKCANNSIIPAANVQQVRKFSRNNAFEFVRSRETIKYCNAVLAKKFPLPMKSLNNIFDTIAKNRSDESYRLTFYSSSKGAEKDKYWESTIKIKWPSEMKFVDVAYERNQANIKVALRVLDYLFENRFITKEFRPLLHGTFALPPQKVNEANLLPSACAGFGCNANEGANLQQIRPFSTYREIELVKSEETSQFENIYNDAIASEDNALHENSLATLWRKFPLPTQTLNNIYNTVAGRKADNSYRIIRSSSSTGINNKWEVAIKLKWPRQMIFVDVGNNKKETTAKVALRILDYLYENRFITNDFRPVLHDTLSLPPQIVNEPYFPPVSFLGSALKANEGVNMQQIRQFSTNNVNELVNSKETENDSNDVVAIENSGLNKTSFAALLKKFPAPKNILNNIYDTVAMDKKDPSYKIHSYSTNKGTKDQKYWEITIKLKWPKEINVIEVGKTTKEASTKAALSVLDYLLKNKHITKDFHPILYDKETLSKQKGNDLNLSPQASSGLEKMIKTYENEFVPYLVDQPATFEQENEIDSYSFESLPDFGTRPRRRHGIQKYMAKELVELPITKYKDEIIDTVRNNQVTIIKGEPGCGKSTRIPQYLLEGWALDENASENCNILVTQPRRIAAISLAERVANERRENIGSVVGYHVRLKSNFNSQTGHILYCTTGILLRKLQYNPNLNEYTHIILDEAHERDINTDLLINLMRMVLKDHPHLKLLIMSATIDAGIFQDYFKDAAIIHIPGFTHPVKENFLTNLPKTMHMCETDNPTVVHEDVAQVIQHIHGTRDEGAILCFLPGWDDILKVSKYLPQENDLHVIFLHSRIQDADQRLIFSKPPPGIRKVILATNIAETSVTIDDVGYVIDSGIQKEIRFDVDKGIVCMDNHWISKASMTQRKGRAGRVKPGESFHLYPKGKHDQFIEFSMPEILRTSLTKIILNCKVISNNMKAKEFLSQLLSPPEDAAIEKAVEELTELKLLDDNENLTPLGRCLSDFQIEPKLAKAMVHSVIFKCVTPIVDIVTLFSSETELFANGILDRDDMNRCKSGFSKKSDHLSMMRILEKWLEYVEDGDDHSARMFYERNGLIGHRLRTMQQLREIHFGYLQKGLLKALNISNDNSDYDELVTAVLLSGVGTVLMHRNYDFVKGRVKPSNILLTRNYKATITSESVNYKRTKFPSKFLLYINETRSNIRRSTVVRETSLISPLAVLLFKNDPIIIKEVGNDCASDKVTLHIKNTPIEFNCTRSDAELIKKSKECIESVIDYYIFQLTKGGEQNEELNEIWDIMLNNIIKVLKSQEVPLL